MTEINLLRWHKENYAKNQKKSQQYFIRLFIFCGCFFLATHALLAWMKQKSSIEIFAVKNKLIFYQRFKSVGSSAYPTLDMAEINKIQFSQKRFWQLLEVLNCFGINHVNVNKVNFQEKQINIIGQVASASALSSSLDVCRVKKNITMRKITFEHLKYSGWLEFSLVIV